MVGGGGGVPYGIWKKLFPLFGMWKNKSIWKKSDLVIIMDN